MRQNQKGSALLLYLCLFQILIVFAGLCIDGIRLLYSDIVLNGAVRHAAISSSTAMLAGEEYAKDIAMEVVERNCKGAEILEMVSMEMGMKISAQIDVNLYFMPLVTDVNDKTILASYTAYVAGKE